MTKRTLPLPAIRPRSSNRATRRATAEKSARAVHLREISEVTASAMAISALAKIAISRRKVDLK